MMCGLQICCPKWFDRVLTRFLCDWYIPNLQDGVKYFFVVSAIDLAGNESFNRSEVVSGTPTAAEPFIGFMPEDVLAGLPAGLFPAAMGLVAPATTAPTGQETWLIVLVSLVITELYLILRRRGTKKRILDT